LPGASCAFTWASDFAAELDRHSGSILPGRIKGLEPVFIEVVRIIWLPGKVDTPPAGSARNPPTSRYAR
jgi:hypothetical protein